MRTITWNFRLACAGPLYAHNESQKGSKAGKTLHKHNLRRHFHKQIGVESLVAFALCGGCTIWLLNKNSMQRPGDNAELCSDGQINAPYGESVPKLK